MCALIALCGLVQSEHRKDPAGAAIDATAYADALIDKLEADAAAARDAAGAEVKAYADTLPSAAPDEVVIDQAELDFAPPVAQTPSNATPEVTNATPAVIGSPADGSAAASTNATGGSQ